jgi:hypothetical protein
MGDLMDWTTTSGFCESSDRNDPLAQQRTILSAERGDVIWLNQENVGFKRQKYGI